MGLHTGPESLTERARICLEPQEYAELVLPNPPFEMDGVAITLELACGDDGRASLSVFAGGEDDRFGVELWVGDPAAAARAVGGTRRRRP